MDWRGLVGAEGGARFQARALLVLAMFVFATVLLRTAWLSDDAYITFRTVDNFLNGHGLRWNVAERVQSYTHPLWMFVVSGLVAVTREFYFTVIFASISLSVVAVWLLVSRIGHSISAGVLAVGMLISSKAFIDYSSSGLENPLTHLLLVVFAMIWFRAEREHRMNPSTLAQLCVLACLCAFNRLDTILFFLPPLALVLLRVRAAEGGWRRSLGAVGIGFLPLLLWEGFSLVYYGFPFPNTAYAKLATGIPRSELFRQGVHYLWNSLSQDPATLMLIVLAALVALRRHRPAGLATMGGAFLYILYVVWMGGDFMSGRFLAAPLLFATVYLASVEWLPRPALLPATLMIIGVGLVGPNPSLLSGEDYAPHLSSMVTTRKPGPVDERGVSDERAFYYHASGLLTASRSRSMPVHRWAMQGKDAAEAGDRVVTRQAAGFFGYYAGPSVHIIDTFGLSDALLSRLPLKSQPAGWRIGHFERSVPPGYRLTLTSGAIQLANDELADYYAKLSRIIRGDLFSKERWGAIWELNLRSPPTGDSGRHAKGDS